MGIGINLWRFSRLLALWTVKGRTVESRIDLHRHGISLSDVFRDSEFIIF